MFNPTTDTDFTRESYVRYGNDYLLKASDSKYFFDLYSGGRNLEDPRIAPLRNPDLRNAPTAWIGVAEYDILRDEGEAYARRIVGWRVSRCMQTDFVLDALEQGKRPANPS